MAQVYCGCQTVESAALHARAARAAAGLEGLGIKARDAIALLMRNDLPFLEASLAAARLGAFVVPINWHSSPSEARYVIEDSGAKVLLAHADLLADLSGGVPQGVTVVVAATPPAILADYALAPGPGDPLPGALLWDELIAAAPPLAPRPVASAGSIIYTSGTTGRPKGVRRAPRTAAEVQAGKDLTRAVFGLEGWEERIHEAVLEVPGPLYHAGPNSWSLHFVQSGASLVLDTRFDPERTLQNIERRRVTHLLAVPTMFVRLLKLPPAVRAKYDLSSLRFVLHGAAPCAPHIKQAMIDWIGPIICETYGSTESGSLTLSSSQDWLAHPGTVGRPLADSEIRILDGEGRPLPQGEVGEIAARRPSHGDFTYQGDDAKRLAMARPGGLVGMGDLGYLDPDGFLHLVGRASDMVISGGVNIYPAEIEAELLRMPGVLDCAVFGIPDDEFGEQLCAYVQPQPGADLSADEVRRYVRERLSPYKSPRRVEFVAELPREDSGKIFKRKLRAPFWAQRERAI